MEFNSNETNGPLIIYLCCWNWNLGVLRSKDNHMARARSWLVLGIFVVL
jgi:hypothetical protein